MEQIQFSFYPFQLQFKYPFKIATIERNATDNVYLLARKGRYSGWGECVFIPYYPETLDMFKEVITELPPIADTDHIEHTMQRLREKFPNRPFCLAAIDIALHHLHQSITGVSIGQLYGLDKNNAPSSFTLGMADDESMERKFFEHQDQAYFKLKVNQQEIARIVKKFRSLTDKPFTIDANQGFTDRGEALKWTYTLADLGVAYFEQPFKRDDWESHAWLKARSPIPIIADESFQQWGDLEHVVKYFDGINMKLMKCGGVAEGVKILRRAAEMELKRIIGCMSESSVVSHAANKIAGLANWVDLDGPLLIKNDLFAHPTDDDAMIAMLSSKVPI